MKDLGFFTVKYEDDKLIVLDQTKLPTQEVYIELQTKEDVWDAIKKLIVRGAPCIGVAAAYGLYVSVKDFCPRELGADCTERKQALVEYIKQTADYIDSARPTAVNLRWALFRCVSAVETAFQNQPELKGHELKELILSEAKKIHTEDVEATEKMAEYGLSLLKPEMGILTHCNAGALATSGFGTCLSPIYLGNERGYNFHVFSDETRPLLQGARLTSWELFKSGADVTLICDNMASTVMKSGKIDAVVVGCDRMAANGDGANKIGTSGVAILAHEYGIPFYMYVPTSSLDLTKETGKDIPIEEREGSEIYRMWYEKEMAPSGVKTFNPAFDVTDNKYITAVITEKGICYPPYTESLKKIMGK